MITDKQPPELNEAELAAIDELHQPGWKKGIEFFMFFRIFSILKISQKCQFLTVDRLSYTMWNSHRNCFGVES